MVIIMKKSIPLTWRRIPERYRLEGVKCTNCGTNYFPKRPICTKCRRAGKLENTSFSGKGKIYSFTEITAPPEGFEDQTPYVLGIIQLDEGPRITGQIVGKSGNEVKIGDEVRTVFRIIQKDNPEGLIHYGFKFELVK